MFDDLQVPFQCAGLRLNSFVHEKRFLQIKPPFLHSRSGSSTDSPERDGLCSLRGPAHYDYERVDKW
jgi:hypothetical protein